MLCIYHQFTARLTYKAVKFPSTWSNTSGNLFFFYNVIYLFTFGCAGSLLLWGLFSSGGVWASPWDGFSGCRAWARGCMGFSSRGTLSCSAGVGHVGSSQPRGQISVFWLTGGFFITDWAAREDRYWYMDTIDITLLSDKWLANIFSQSVTVLSSSKWDFTIHFFLIWHPVCQLFYGECFYVYEKFIFLWQFWEFMIFYKYIYFIYIFTFLAHGFIIL